MFVAELVETPGGKEKNSVKKQEEIGIQPLMAKTSSMPWRSCNEL